MASIEKIKLTDKVWIVVPHCHGNGGWCGYSTLSSKKGMQLKRALSIKNPSTKYNYDTNWQWEGVHGSIRIATKPDPNYSIYFFDEDDEKWMTF